MRFLYKLKLTNFVIFFREKGKDVKELIAKLTAVRDVSETKQEGIEPVKRLLKRDNEERSDKAHISGGKVPVILFDPKSKAVKRLIIPKKLGRVPVKLFPEKTRVFKRVND